MGLNQSHLSWEEDINRPSVMNLPEEALSIKFKSLELNQQVSAALVCPRYLAVLRNLWRTTYQDRCCFISWRLEDRDLIMLLTNICDTVQKMNLFRLNFQQWKIIKQNTYPSAKELTLSFDDSSYSKKLEPFSNNCVADLIKHFPNLRLLYLDGCIINEKDLNNLKSFRFLEHLDLYGELKFEFSHFEKLLEVLQLKSLGFNKLDKNRNKWTSRQAFEKFCALERIHIGSYFKLLPLNILHFSNLKELGGHFCGENTDINILNKIIRDIAKFKHNELTEILFGSDFPLRFFLESKFENLKKLIMLNRDICDFFDISRCAPNLREIVFRGCGLLTKEQLFKLLNSSQLEFIDVFFCKCEFTDLCLNVNDIVQNRYKLLHFNFEFNRFEDKFIDLNVIGSSPLLKITYDSTMDDIDHFIFKFQ